MSVKSAISKLNFRLGNSPSVESSRTRRAPAPETYQAVVTITSDFELAWAWRYMKGSDDPYATALEKARLERKNIPSILELCERYQIPITWATVGHLFLTSCGNNGEPHANIPRPRHFENEYWKFTGNDWFEFDPRSNVTEASEWYAPDLVDRILQSGVKHEIGCHTFSHIDCRDEVCPAELFGCELKECMKEAARIGLNLRSFVHPGHTIGNLDGLAGLGFTSFQTDPGNILGCPVRHKNGLWELKRTYEFVYREGWSDDYHIHRYRTIVKRAIENYAVCNFWFHPSMPGRFVERVLPPLFEFMQSQRDRIWVTSVGDYVDWLNGKNDD